MSTNPTPSTLRARWSRDDLLCMLQQRDWPSPPLCLKDGHTEVRRVWLIDKAGKGKACIEKHYTRKLSANQQREVEFLAKCSRNNLLKARIACLVKTEASGTMQSEVFHTEWGGLDLQQWHTLLGASNPLTNSIPGLLFLIKKILEACHDFHRLGLVHNDLHCANLILDYDYDPQQHSITLKPDQIRLIDFEFSLRPRADQPPPKALTGQAERRDLQIEARTATEWRQANGDPTLLEPNLHSPHVCAAVCENALSKRCKVLHRRYRRGKDDAFQYLPAVFGNLEKVDFGVDFFTLGQSLKHMIRKAARYWDNAHTSQWEEAHDFLLGLPAMLQEWDQELPQQVRAVPHQELMSAIQEKLGNWNMGGKLTVRLPGSPFVPSVTAAAAVAVKPKWRFWLYGGGTLVSAVLGWILASHYPEEFAATITPIPHPAIRSPSNIVPDPHDRLTITWGQQTYSAQLDKDGKFQFPHLPANARGQSVGVSLAGSERAYEATSRNLTLGEYGALLHLRHKTRLLGVTVTQIGTAKIIGNASVWVPDQDNGPSEARKSENNEYLLSIRADRTERIRVYACAPGYGPETYDYTPSNDVKKETMQIPLSPRPKSSSDCPPMNLIQER
ncbi:MAG: hypothetical protein RL748_2636 [Pseudomonadota bacterium]